jgi:Tol biopolymer transport system component
MSSTQRSALSFVLAAVVVLVTPASATFPGKNGRIAFIQNTGTNGSDVFTMNPDGSDMVQLTQIGTNGGQTCCVSWSPDGKQLVFSAVLSAITNPQIWAMNADGSAQHLLVNDPSFADSDPNFSPDGQQIVFTRCGVPNCAIFRVQADGTGIIAITHFNSNGDIIDLWPAYSPDGKTIAFTSFNRNNGFLCAIYLVDADGSNFRILTPPRLTAFKPDWSPDGKEIVFSTNSNFSTILDEEIWVIHVNGSGPVRLTNNNKHWNGYFSGRHDFSPSWSPQGDEIVFERDRPDFSRFAIYVISPDGSNPKMVLQGAPGRHREVPSPSGMPRRPTAQRDLKLIEHGGFTPRWGPAPN